MPRPGRNFEEGRIYHVYNRVSGGERVFADDVLAERFVAILRRVISQDGVVVLAWALLSNHYHLIVRQGPVPLSRTMKALQQGVTRFRNRRHQTYGPLWQGRFKAKVVIDEDYLMQLIAYVHLNSVKSGLAESADGYRWSGHREVIDRRRDGIVAVDDVLLVYGDNRRQAVRSYRSAMAAVSDEEWSGESPGRLPWWRLGRPSDDELRRRDVTLIDEQGRSTARWRPRYSADEWLEIACRHLAVDREDLAERGRHPDVVQMRELVGLIGIERYGVKVTELAEILGKSRDGVSKWMRRGVERRAAEPEFAEAAQALDLAASEESWG